MRDDPALLRGDPALLRDDPALLRDDPALLRDDPALLRADPALPRADPAFRRVAQRRPVEAGSGEGSVAAGEQEAREAAPPQIVVLPPAIFRDVDPFGVEPPLAVLRVEPLPPWDAERDSGGLTLFLPLGDPENVGAALRSAAAFEVDRVVLLEEAAYPFHPRAIRAAAGTCFDLELRAGPPLARLMEAGGGRELLVLDREGEPLGAVEPAARRGLLVGEEGAGTPPAEGLRRVAIPISPRVESLNAAVAVGIALWELRRHG